MRREPLEEGRNGLVESHHTFILARNGRVLQEWIDDPYAVDYLAVLPIFGEKLAAAGLLC